MNPELLKKFNLLEETRHRIIFRVSPLDDENFNRSPAEGKWSVGQVLAHLLQVEQFSVRYVNKKLNYREGLKKTGIGASFRFFLLRFFLRLPVKYRAPGQVSTVPAHVAKDEVLKQWEENRMEMAKMLDNFPPELLNKNIFKHLVAGRLSISHMLDFIHDHIVHHQRQIDELVS